MIYFKNLDGVRAIAALMVMFYHFFNTLPTETPLGAWLVKGTALGQTGVTLFFVLSGFLITRILLSTKTTEGYFKNFYVRRTLRIFPLYYGYLALHYFVLPYILPEEQVEVGQQWPYWVYLQNFAMTFEWDALGPWHFWSLAVEEHFYLFWPLAVYLLSAKGLMRFIIGITVFSVALRAFMHSEGYEVFYLTFTRFDSLAVGALLALGELKAIFEVGNPKKFLRLGIVFTILTGAGWILFDQFGYQTLIESRYLLTSLMYFFWIGYVLSLPENSWVNRVLSAKFLNFSGRISYGLYVFHPFAFGLAAYYFASEWWWVNLLLCFGITYAMATLSFYGFERRFLGLKRYFEYSRPAA